MLKSLNEPVTIDVFVDKKDLPSEVKKLENSIAEFLIDCKEYGKSNLQFNFLNPYEGLIDSAQTEWKIRFNIFMVFILPF